MNLEASVVRELVATALVVVFAASGAAETTQRVSLSSTGEEGNDDSVIWRVSWSISWDGRYVAFESRASNLVPGDTNGCRDIFVRDLQLGITERVSVDTGGTQGDADSRRPSISADGRYVAFVSIASNLVPGDTNGRSDIFVHDRKTAVTELVSVVSGTIQANHDSNDPSISADGRFVAFDSNASNLIPGDTNGAKDVFVKDRQTGTIECVSVTSDGALGNDSSLLGSISGDGRFVAFESYAYNLVSGDTNQSADVFVHDRQTRTTELASMSSAGLQGNGESSTASISADGRNVVFQSAATNLVSADTNGAVDIFLHDRSAGSTELVSVSSVGAQANNSCFEPLISSGGGIVAFDSGASNLVPGDTNAQLDVFVRDLQRGITERVSISSAGVEASGYSWFPSLSGNGLYVIFASWATDLVPGDTNQATDVFVRGPLDTCLFCDGFESGDTSFWAD
jgi:Tol biopolymer transport system component